MHGPTLSIWGGHSEGRTSHGLHKFLHLQCHLQTFKHDNWRIVMPDKFRKIKGIAKLAPEHRDLVNAMVEELMGGKRRALAILDQDATAAPAEVAALSPPRKARSKAKLVEVTSSRNTKQQQLQQQQQQGIDTTPARKRKSSSHCGQEPVDTTPTRRQKTASNCSQELLAASSKKQEVTKKRRYLNGCGHSTVASVVCNECGAMLCGACTENGADCPCQKGPLILCLERGLSARGKAL